MCGPHHFRVSPRRTCFTYIAIQTLQPAKWVCTYPNPTLTDGSLPTAYPFLVSSLWMLHDTALAKAHVENAPSATTCPHKNFDRYTSNNMYQPPQVSWIWHAYPYTALPAGSRVEVIHEADPFGDETHGMWLQYAPGSGIYFDLGKTIAFDEHSNAYSYFHISGVKDYNSAMSKAAAAQGYDSIQFLKHVDHVSYQCEWRPRRPMIHICSNAPPLSLIPKPCKPPVPRALARHLTPPCTRHRLTERVRV